MYKAIIDSVKSAAPPPAPEDYRDIHGFLMCGKCHTRKESDVDFLGELTRVPIICKCAVEKREKERVKAERDRIRAHISRLQKEGITDEAYLRHTFDKDDGNSPKATEISKRYVECWEEMKRENIGLLFLGNVGAGKSFFACCIANALIEKGVPVCVTNLTKLIKQTGKYNAEFDINDLQSFELLVIDDIGAERESSFTCEQIYNIIDTRYRSGKPLIITTNLSPAELKNASLEKARIYDRILEMCCVPVVMDNPSRRRELAREAQKKALALLYK